MPINIVMKTYLITGCSSGLGYAMTVKLLNEGNIVIPILRDPAIALDLINTGHGRCHPIIVDLNDPNLYYKVHDKISDKKIDVVMFNAAPNLQSTSLAETSPTEIQRTMNVVVVAHFIIFEAIKPYLVDDATIVAVSSRMGSVTKNANGDFSEIPRPPAYKMAKASLNMLMAIIHDENPSYKCVCFHPGLLQTKMGSMYGMHPNEVSNYMIEFIKNDTNNSFEFIDIETGESLPW